MSAITPKENASCLWPGVVFVATQPDASSRHSRSGDFFVIRLRSCLTSDRIILVKFVPFRATAAKRNYHPRRDDSNKPVRGTGSTSFHSKEGDGVTRRRSRECSGIRRGPGRAVSRNGPLHGGMTACPPWRVPPSPRPGVRPAFSSLTRCRGSLVIEREGKYYALRHHQKRF